MIYYNSIKNEVFASAIYANTHRGDKEMKKRYIRMSIIILLLIVIDQAIKNIVISNKIVLLSNVKVECIQNFGGAFGIGGNSTLFFVLVNIVVLGIIIKFIYSQKDRIDKKTLASFTLILSGGFSNLIDRIFRGYVADYIDITNLIDFPIFNLADVFVVVGWILLLVCIIIYWYKEVKITTN